MKKKFIVFSLFSPKKKKSNLICNNCVRSEAVLQEQRIEFYEYFINLSYLSREKKEKEIARGRKLRNRCFL